MNYSDVQIINATANGIECLVTFDEIGQIPFHATAHDVTTHGQEIYSRCIAGDFGVFAAYTKPISEYKFEFNTKINNKITQVLNSYNYDDEQQLSTYAARPNQYQSEAQMIQQFIINIWTAYENLSDEDIELTDMDVWVSNHNPA